MLCKTKLGERQAVVSTTRQHLLLIGLRHNLLIWASSTWWTYELIRKHSKKRFDMRVPGIRAIRMVKSEEK